MCSFGEAALEPLLLGYEIQLLQARDLRLREATVREVGQRLSPPERERLDARAGLDQSSEPVGVELVLLDPQRITSRVSQKRSRPSTARSCDT